MDVNSAFLNGTIIEEVYINKPLEFYAYDFLNHVYKLNKALYSLKQAPRALYKRLSNFLLENYFKKG